MPRLRGFSGSPISAAMVGGNQSHAHLLPMQHAHRMPSGVTDMKFAWLVSILLIAILVKGVASGGLSGPNEIPQRALAHEATHTEQGKLRLTRPAVAQVASEPQSDKNEALADARIAAEAMPEAKPADARWVKVTGNVVNVRMRPDLAADTVTSYRRNTELQLLRERAEWMLVLDPETRSTGWMHRDYLDGIEKPRLAGSAARG